jgi:hypothetical protein
MMHCYGLLWRRTKQFGMKVKSTLPLRLRFFQRNTGARKVLDTADIVRDAILQQP